MVAKPNPAGTVSVAAKNVAKSVAMMSIASMNVA